jgi:predicted PurR-regulated permease PerM
LNFNLTVILKYLQVIVFASVVLYFGKAVLIPLSFSLLISIVMYPVCKWLELRKVPKSVAIALSLSLVTVLLGLVIWLFIWEVRLFWTDLPQLLTKLETSLPQLQGWIETTFGFTADEQLNWLKRSSLDDLPAVLKGTLNATLDTFFYLFLTPVFTALFLYHRHTFLVYLQLIAGSANRLSLQKIIQQTTHTYFHFIKGMVIVYFIVGVLNSIGLMALGVKHAVLFGMLTAVMTVIPYVGIIVSALLPISVAWITMDSVWYPVGVIAVFAVVQYLEANVIFPMVVGTQLNLSTWATLIAILAGGILWGVAGMILFIPFLAVLKIISDHVVSLKPLNVLLSRT